MACPLTTPNVIDSPVTALIFVRSLGGNKSLESEYVNGAAPPTAMPVSARNRYNCPNVVTPGNHARTFGHDPNKSVHAKSFVRE